MIREPRAYRGVNIYPASGGSSGIRWSASTGSGLVLKADTLDGIKALIRKEKPTTNTKGQTQQ